MRILQKLLALSLGMVFLLSFVSCEHLPNMRELLAYQGDGTVIRARVTDGKVFEIEVTLGEVPQMTIQSEAGKELIRVCFHEGGATLLHGDMMLPLAATARLRAYDWMALLRLPDEVVWTIRRERLGGIEVFACACDEINLYLDASTRGPLLILNGKIRMNILSVDVSEKNADVR